MIRFYLDVRVEHSHSICSTDALRLAHMLPLKQELSVQVTDINRIQVYHLNVDKPSQDKVLKQLAANATSSNNEYFSVVLNFNVGVSVNHGCHLGIDCF